jgi:hypothetical protein
LVSAKSECLWPSNAAATLCQYPSSSSLPLQSVQRELCKIYARSETLYFSFYNWHNLL